MTILNRQNVDYTTNPIFLGEPLSLQRYDKFKYEEIFKLFQQHQEQNWWPHEFEVSKDREEFYELQPHEQFIFTKNLLYQTMMDSVVARGSNIFAKYVTNPELEAYISLWQYFEVIHSYSYTYIIKNVYANPSEILDQALEDKEILARANSVSESYDKLNSIDISSKEKLKEQIYLSLVDVNILEAVRFYVSFVCAFAFAENKTMIGNADIIGAIRKDEALHYRATQFILNLLRERDDEGFTKIVKRLEDRAIEMYVNAAEEEKKWSAYLFQHGSILGLNEQILSKYIEWLTDSRMNSIGLPKQFNTKNPISGWLDKWVNPSSIQNAPQEKVIGAVYKMGATKNDISSIDYDNL